MKRVRHIVTGLALVLLVGAGGASAADVSVTATIEPAVAEVGSEVVLTVTVQGKFRRSASPQLPPLEDFDVYESGSSQNFSFVNGQINSSITFSYVLVPRAEGQLVIAPITFTIADKQYATKPLTLEAVTAGNTLAPQSQEQAPPVDTPDADQSIFVAASVDRDTVYVNQQITWTLGYYTDGRVNLLRSPNYTPPEAEGFWVEDLPPQNKYYTRIHDRQYLVNEIKRAYFPTGPGIYTIGPAKVDVVIDDPSTRNRRGDFFRSLTRGFGQQHSLTTKRKQVVVLPLPTSGKPAGFNGIVAEDLRVSMSVDKQVTQVGEPVNLTIEINGRGNMKTISPPSLSGVEGFKVYESGSSVEMFKKNYVVAGRKKYEFVLVPQSEGKLSIPPVRIPYFDPSTGSYDVAKSYPVPLDVRPGTKEEGRRVMYAGGDDFEVINRDIRFIHSAPSSVTMSAARLLDNRLFLALHALPLLAVVASMFVQRRRQRLEGDVGFARSSRAMRDALRKLRAGEKSVAGGDPSAGVSALADALSGYFADKMNVSRAGLTSDSVSAFLGHKGVDAELMARTAELFAICDAARFAPGTQSGDDVARALSRAREALRRIERGHLS
ncbi:MAG: protein BatD [Candidatus Krumholzibacteriota bacterium]|nr:protein BatD [Candidatus Krumholzibacteriota bacterium]